MKRHTKREFFTNTAAVFTAAAVTPTLHSSLFSAEESATVHQVTISKFKFEPDQLILKPGDMIVWTNLDIAPHTATASDKSWNTGKINKDQSMEVRVTPDMDGEYFCQFHPNMKGRLMVET